MTDFKTPSEARLALSVYSKAEDDAAIAAKAPIASPTFTGTVSGVTKTMVGLGNADNTSDANKPVSSAQAAALAAKADTSSLGALAAKNSIGTTDIELLAVTNGRIADGEICNPKLFPMIEGGFKMRPLGAGAGTPIDGTPLQAKIALALELVNNTTDAGKPVSTAQAAALALKSDKTAALGRDALGTAEVATAPRIPFRNIVDTAPIQPGATSHPYFIAGSEIGRLVVAEGPLDLQSFPGGGVFEVVTPVGITATIYGGPTANWRGQTAANRTIVLAADTHLTIRKVSADDLLVIVHRGSITSNADVPAPRSRTIVALGESHAQYWGDYGGMAGLQRALVGRGLSGSVWPVTAAFGGATLLEGNQVAPDNYFWMLTDFPGPRAIQARDRILDAMAAGQPAPQDVLVILGENEVDNLSAAFDATPTTIVAWKEAAKSLVLWLRTELGLPNLRFHWMPTGARDFQVFGAGSHTALREAQVDLSVTDPNIFLGPEMYDLSRAYNDTHLDFSGMVTLGRRFAAHVANVADGQANHLGPTITAFTAVDAQTFDVSIVDNGGASLLSPLPAIPQGFALIPPGDAIGAVPATITDFVWIYAAGVYTLRIKTAADATGYRLAYPWGELTQIRGPRVRNASFLPLRTWPGA